MRIPETERGPVFTVQSTLRSWGMPAFYVVFLALAVIQPLFYLRHPLLHDEMIYLVVGREVASGGVLYAGIADHKTPAIYYLSALLWETVPEPYLAGRTLVYAVHAATALLVFRLGSLWGRPVAAIGSLAYLFGVYAPVFDGFVFMTEPFAVLFLTAAVLWLFAKRRVTDLLAGLSLAFGVLFNQTVLLFGVVVICWSLPRLYARETDRAPGTIGNLLARAREKRHARDLSHHRVTFAVKDGGVIAECPCDGFHYRGWCAHVALLWWRWAGKCDLCVTDLDTRHKYLMPPPWLSVGGDGSV